jgi:hypothetical protein
MSHVIELPDDLFHAIERYAAQRGQPVDELAADLLARELARTSPSSGPTGPDWTTASAEEIIESIRASRVERERPVEL